MRTVARLLVAFVGLEHLGFLVLEMFLWTRPAGMRTFGLTPEFAAASADLAANQGLYNGFLAAGLLWGLWRGERGRAVQTFFLVCVVVAGVFGALTAKPSILVVQAVPGLLALGAVGLARRGANGDFARISGPPHHLDLSVGDPQRSIPFYATLLEALGYRRWRPPSPDWQEPDPQRATWRIPYPGGAMFDVEVRPARP